MKKLLWGLGVLFAATLIVFVIWIQIRAHRENAIIAVINQASAAMTQKRELPNGNTIVIHANTPGFSLRVYTNQLRQISTVQCPEPFQLAWLNFVQTTERAERPFAGLGSTIEFTVSAITPDGSGTTDALARLDKLDPQQAWMRVQIVALRYGVQIH
jgi:hypothetical protein